MNRFLLCILMFLTGTGIVSAQNTLGISIFKQSADTLYYNQTLSLNVFNAFYGPQGSQFNGNIGYKYSINNVLQTDTLFPSGSSNFTIYANTAVLGSVDIPISVAKFAGGGGHTIIVWPIVIFGDSLGWANVDSAKIFVAGWLGVEKAIPEHGTSIYPNPCKSNVAIQSGAENPIKTWKIIGLDGRVWLQNSNFNSTDGIIQLGNLPSGIYLIEVEFSDGSRSFHKILKE